MPLGTFSIRSTSIVRTTSFNVILPAAAGPFSVLYLLGGYGDDHTGYLRWTNLERYASQYNLLIVMPDGGRGFYVNDPRPGGTQYEDYIAVELIRYIDNWFPTIRKPSGRAVAGLSMGGYGALVLSMRHPDLFSVASSHSGALAFSRDGRFNCGSGKPDAVDLAAALPPGKYCLDSLAREFARSGSKLPIRIDCGTGDYLLEYNRQFHSHLTSLGLPHEYHEFPGLHEWAYWDAHIGETLKFVTKHLASA